MLRCGLLLLIAIFQIHDHNTFLSWHSSLVIDRPSDHFTIFCTCYETVVSGCLPDLSSLMNIFLTCSFYLHVLSAWCLRALVLHLFFFADNLTPHCVYIISDIVLIILWILDITFLDYPVLRSNVQFDAQISCLLNEPYVRRVHPRMFCDYRSAFVWFVRVIYISFWFIIMSSHAFTRSRKGVSSLWQAYAMCVAYSSYTNIGISIPLGASGDSTGGADT
jgi:hypothetical protein